MPHRRNRHAGFWVPLVALILLAGCTSAPSPEGDSAALELCQEPRPEMCTRDYTPVCGEKESGVVMTYANACTACTDKSVIGYRPGSCPQDATGSAE